MMGRTVEPGFAAWRVARTRVRRPDRPTWRGVLLVSAALWALPTVSCSAPAGGAAVTLDESQARELHLLLDVLRDARLEAPRRRDAALTLLDRPWAVESVQAELGPEGEPRTQQVLVRALASRDAPPPAPLAQALFELLSRAEPPLSDDVAAALGRYRQPQLQRQLISLAGNRRAPLPARTAAVLTLGHHRSRDVAEALVGLLDENGPGALREAAVTALGRLSGINGQRQEPDFWRQWWQQRRNLSDEQWLSHVIDNYAARVGQLETEQRQIQARLIDIQSRLYRATAQEQRPELLLDMLGDDSVAMRQLAVKLMDQRLIDGQPFDDQLRLALRERLGDASPAIRQGVARLLRDLGDAPGADAVAQRLASGEEADAAVVRAFLLVMVQMPRAAAVDRAAELLSDESLRAEVAGFLAKATEAGLLGEPQIADVAARVRRMIPADRPPEPYVIQLLGRIADEDDWARIAIWLDSEDAVVKKAAATAWADSDRPLAPLAQRADDAVVQPIVIDAATRRGAEPGTFLALVGHKPAQEQAAQAWQRALAALAQRVGPDAVLQGDAILAQRDEAIGLREQLLTAAIAAISVNGGSGQDEVERLKLARLLLGRAFLLLAEGSVARGQADLEHVATLNAALPAADEARRQLGLLQAHLASGQLEPALELARQLVGPTDPPAEPVAPDHPAAACFLAAIERRLAAEQPEQAKQIIAALREVLGGAASDELGRQLAAFEARVNGNVADAGNGDEAPTDGASENGDATDPNGATTPVNATTNGE